MTKLDMEARDCIARTYGDVQEFSVDNCATLQQRHISATAAIIKMLPYRNKRSRRWIVATHFADAIGACNSRFNRARFLAACGVKE